MIQRAALERGMISSGRRPDCRRAVLPPPHRLARDVDQALADHRGRTAAESHTIVAIAPSARQGSGWRA